jgi:hypothetical protein
MGILTLSALLNTLKIPVNGYFLTLLYLIVFSPKIWQNYTSIKTAFFLNPAGLAASPKLQ